MFIYDILSDPHLEAHSFGTAIRCLVKFFASTLMQARCPLVQYTFSEAHSTQQLFSLIDYDHRVDPIALFM